MKRITLITGHFGSGKTEFSVNLTVDLKKKFNKIAILDLDIANPYFRSRERQKMLGTFRQQYGRGFHSKETA